MLPYQTGTKHYDFTFIFLATGLGILFGIYLSEIAEGKQIGAHSI